MEISKKIHLVLEGKQRKIFIMIRNILFVLLIFNCHLLLQNEKKFKLKYNFKVDLHMQDKQLEFWI